METIFEVYGVGAIYASVCTNLPIGEASIRLNNEHPTGISSRWGLSGDDFADGTPNPCPCERNPESKHYLFNC